MGRTAILQASANPVHIPLFVIATRLPPLAAAVLACACGPIVREAAFPARVDTVQPAALLGPYDGQVIDAETATPLADALVSASWGFSRGVGLRGPAGGALRESRTDADGRYRVAMLEDLPSGVSTAVSSFTLIVYKTGYAGWRSDRAATRQGWRPRRDFAQHGNRIQLRRLGADEPRAPQVAYLGVWGGPATIARAAAGDVAPAIVELDRPEPFADDAPVLQAARLLPPEDVRAETGYGGGFEARKLRDPPTTAGSDTHHLRAVDAPERFDVALRVWRPSSAALAEAQFERLLRTYPGAVERNDLGDRSFRAAEAEILAVGFFDRSRGVVGALTCGVGLCPDHEVALRLARRVTQRLAEIDREEPAP